MPVAWAVQPAAPDGYLDITTFGADPTGSTDSTAEIQAAMLAAYDQRMVAWFPPGTYLVSDTLYGAQEYNTREKAHVLLGSTAGAARPKLVLSPAAAGFDDPAEVKPVIYIWSLKDGLDFAEWRTQRPNDEVQNPGTSFNQVVRGIDIEIPPGLSGAAGISLHGAQGCSVEEITITLGEGFAGLYDLPGVGGVIADIEVIGGRYGIHAKDSKFPALSGVRLTGQSNAAIAGHQGVGPMTLAGFRIFKDAAPAIVTQQQGTWTGSSFASGNLNLVDGSIEFATRNGEPAIDNGAAQDIVLRNVYLKNSASVIQSGGLEPLASSPAGFGGWKQVAEYAYRSPGIGRLFVDGVEQAGAEYRPAQIITADGFTAADAEALVARHSYNAPEPFVSVDDPGVVNVRDHGIAGDGETDIRVALQALIDDPAMPDRLFLPKGEYLLGGTLTLGENTKLIGAGKHLTELRPTDSWEPQSEETILTTVDSGTADTALADLRIAWPTTPYKDYFNGITWRAGRNSVVRDIYVSPDYHHSVPASGNQHVEVRIRGFGGGRWYGLSSIQGFRRAKHPAFRRLVVEDTIQPLAFYNLNIEHAQDESGFWQSEIRRAANVAIYGFKVEWIRGLRIRDSENTALFGYGGTVGLDVTNTPEVLLANLSPQVNDGSMLDVREVNNSGVELADLPDTIVTLLKRDDVDLDAIHPAADPLSGNRPPIASVIFQQSKYVGESGNFDISRYFSDPDADVLTYSVTGLDGSGFTLDTETGVISGWPPLTGAWSLRVTASDAAGGSVRSNTFGLAVIERPCNCGCHN